MRPENPKNKKDILKLAIPLFARGGYNGVSMRQIAKKVGINAASLYYHFPDKQTLYIEAVKQAFLTKELDLSKTLTIKASAHKKLHIFIERLCRFFKDEPDFRALVQREMLDGDEARLQLLATHIFKNFFETVTSLSKELSPDRDPHLLAVSIFALVAYHYQTASIRLYLPGAKPDHNDPEVVSKHVTSLLLQGIENKDQNG